MITVSNIYDDNDSWEAKLAIENIPELPHVINTVRELRKYLIDGIRLGYNCGKIEKSKQIYSEEDLLEVINLSMSLRKSQLNGTDLRSGNEVLETWKQNKNIK